MPSPLQVAATCALPPRMLEAPAAAPMTRKPARVSTLPDPSVSGLRDFAPPQGYAWAFQRPAEVRSLRELEAYTRDQQRQVERFERFERQFGEIRRKMQEAQTWAQRDLLEMTVDFVGADLRSAMASREERDMAQRQLAAANKELDGLKARMASKARRMRESSLAVRRLAQQVVDELPAECSSTDTDAA